MLLYEYDDQGRVTKQTYEDGDTVSYQYDNSGALATVTDSATGRKTTYYYDLTDRMVKYVESGTNYNHSVGYEYNADNNLTSLVETINGTDYTTSYTYDDDNRVTSMTTNGTTVAYTYDAYGRISTQVTKRGSTTILTETYTYVNPTSSTTSSQIATYKTESANYSVTYSYTYDDNGNILSVNDGTNTTSYVYDSANQLRREDNEGLGFTHIWTYDNAGNIRMRAEYPYSPNSLTGVTPTDTVPYTYNNADWGDLLTACDGQAITYDTIGNPVRDSTRTYTWEHGRELARLTQNGVVWNYTYDSNGMRTRRTSSAKTYNYIYSGSQLVQMSVGGNKVNFTYDAGGAPLTITVGGVTFYYVTNIQGDVVGVLSPSGEEVVHYRYDAWGNILSTEGAMASTLGEINPLRYRGYVYDQETELYYLQSRYYDPNVGRFINADSLMNTGQGLLGYNMFAYCLNNPVKYVDVTGYSAVEPPMIENGLNLPASGGWPVVIDGELYYYAVKYNGSGELYEYWFNSNGDLVHVRHHSTHGHPKEHDNPHDHTGKKDKNGNNTENKKPEDVDETFQSPKQVVLDPLDKTNVVQQKAPSNDPVFSHSLSLGPSNGNAIGATITIGVFVGGYVRGFIVSKSCFV